MRKISIKHALIILLLLSSCGKNNNMWKQCVGVSNNSEYTAYNINVKQYGSDDIVDANYDSIKPNQTETYFCFINGLDSMVVEYTHMINDTIIRRKNVTTTNHAELTGNETIIYKKYNN